VDVTRRSAGGEDRELLRRATLDNLNWNGPRFTLDDLDATPEFRHYYQPWPGEGDFGIVATDATGTPRGVVWLKHFTSDDPGYGFIATDVPELSIWVEASQRGNGIGGTLLHAAVDEGRYRGIRAISLSVEDGNPAARLYHRYGFTPAAPPAVPGTHVLSL
jgi:GNAT superfamily N-acetyltransferase